MNNFVSKEEFNKSCKGNQISCGASVSVKVGELKELFITLHKAQTAKIERMDEKRENAKEDNNRELMSMAVAIGKIEKHIEFIANKKD